MPSLRIFTFIFLLAFSHVCHGLTCRDLLGSSHSILLPQNILPTDLVHIETGGKPSRDPHIFKKLEGQNTLVGSFATIEFRYRVSGKSRKHKGRIVSESSTGIKIYDPISRQVISLDYSTGDFLSFQILPIHQERNSPPPSKIEGLLGNRFSGLIKRLFPGQPSRHPPRTHTEATNQSVSFSIKNIIEMNSNQNSPLFLIPLKGKAEFVFGTVEIDQSIPGTILLIVTDTEGQVHQIDPFEAKTQFESQLTVFVDSPENRSLFPFRHEAPIVLVGEPAPSFFRDPNQKPSVEKRIYSEEEIASLPTLQPIQNMGPILSDSQSMAFVNNLDIMGIGFGPREGSIYAQSVWNSLGSLKEDPAIAEYTAILVTPYDDIHQIRMALDLWAQRHGLDFQFYFPADIDALIQLWRADGTLDPNKDWIMGRNGYVAQRLYDQMITEGLFPVGDPHDILFHPASLLSPQFRKNLNRFSGINIRVMDILGNGASKRMRTLSELPSLPPVVQTLVHIHGLFFRIIRDHTVENWSTLMQTSQGPLLHLQGNAPSNAYFPLIDGDHPGFVNSLLSRPGADQSYELLDLSTLVGFHVFLETESNAKKFAKFSELLETQGVSRLASRRLSRKLSDFLDTDAFFVVRRPIPLEEIPVAWKKISEFVSEDPELSAFFSLENKEEFFNLTLDFFESYLDWLETNVGLPTPSDVELALRYGNF